MTKRVNTEDNMPEAAEGLRATSPLKFLWPLLAPYKLSVMAGIAAIALSSAMMMAIGWGLKMIVDRGVAAGSAETLDHALVCLLGVVLFMSLASYARLNLINRVAERLIADLRKKIYAHLLTLDPTWYDQNTSGDQVSRINADTTVLQMVITSNLPSTFRHALMLLGGVVMLGFVSIGMTSIAVLAVPAVILPALYFGRKVRAKSRDTQSSVGHIGSYAQETVQGLQTIQAYGYEDRAASIFSGLADDTYNTALKYIRARAVLAAIVIAIAFGAIGLLLWAGGHKVLAGDMTGGDLAAFIFYAAMVAGAVTAISEAMSDFSRASGAVDRISAVLAAKPVLAGPMKPLASTTPATVAFDDVTFSYPARPDAPALQGVTFDVQQGAVVALVGPSGAGKSTVFQLLQRFYDPMTGRVSIGGAPLCDHAPVDIRNMIGVVAQDPTILSTTVAENIRMGNPNANDAELWAAAEMAQAHDFISNLPQGYNTLLGERGNRLSGGQRQRIAIARAILKDPKILLLDEATSALDAASELAVHNALKTLMHGRTTLIIAHRLSTVQSADKIVVMDKGRVVAQGTHAELYSQNGLYAHLAGLQLAAAEGVTKL